MDKLIYEVSEVNFSVNQFFINQLFIHAKGKSNGCVEPKLVMCDYVHPPEDGIYDFNFFVTPTENTDSECMEVVEADYVVPDMYLDMKGVRIHGETNCIEKKFIKDYEHPSNLVFVMVVIFAIIMGLAVASLL